MIVGGERRLLRELAGQQPARERHAGDDPDLLCQRLGEELLRRLEAEHVEDDLNRLHARLADSAEGLVDRLDADAVVADLARLHHLVEDAEDIGRVVDLRGRTVELQEIDRVHLEVLQATVHPGVQVLSAVALRRLLGEPTARLRGHEEGLARALMPQTGHEALAASVAVDVCRIDEVHTGVDRGVKGLHRLVVLHRAPRATDGPGPEADGRDLHVCSPELPVLHSCLPRGPDKQARSPAHDSSAVPTVCSILSR